MVAGDSRRQQQLFLLSYKLIQQQQTTTTKTTTPTVSSLASWFFSDRLASFTIEIHDSVPSALLLLIRAIVLGSFSIVLLLYRFLVSLLWILTLLISSQMQIVLILICAAIWF